MSVRQTRLDRKFAALKSEGRKAFIAFVTAGDPDPETSFSILSGLPTAGADIIELGMPFTDPMADGPAIQAANIRALKAGTTTADVLMIANEFRDRHPQVPLVLMGYANPMVRRGAEWFAKEAAGAGVDGVICVDIPPEEDSALGPALCLQVRRQGRVAGSQRARLALQRVAQHLHGAACLLGQLGRRRERL